MPIEYRLYYDSTGQVITYTTENIPGTYIIITKEQYAEASPNVEVKNNQLVKKAARIVTKLVKVNDKGTMTNKHDINIIAFVNEDPDYWDIKIYATD